MTMTAETMPEILPREALLRRFLAMEGPGLEIGPSHSPIAPKSEGYAVETLDHCTAAELRDKYAKHAHEGLRLDRIEEVDFVWQGQPYADLTRRPHGYKWVVASHVIEHMPDLIGFLNDCDSVLADAGVLVLAIPDKRYCFDHYRPLSGLGSVIDAHLLQAKRHSHGTIAESTLYYSELSGTCAWGPGFDGAPTLVNDVALAVRKMEEANDSGSYIDCHGWSFTPSGFRLLMLDLFDLGFIRLQVIAFPAPSGCEFYAVMGRAATGAPAPSRDELLKSIQEELAPVQPPPPPPPEPVVLPPVKELAEIQRLRERLDSEKDKVARLKAAIRAWNARCWFSRATRKLRP